MKSHPGSEEILPLPICRESQSPQLSVLRPERITPKSLQRAGRGPPASGTLVSQTSGGEEAVAGPVAQLGSCDPGNSLLGRRRARC